MVKYSFCLLFSLVLLFSFNMIFMSKVQAGYCAGTLPGCWSCVNDAGTYWSYCDAPPAQPVYATGYSSEGGVAYTSQFNQYGSQYGSQYTYEYQSQYGAQYSYEVQTNYCAPTTAGCYSCVQGTTYYSYCNRPPDQPVYATGYKYETQYSAERSYPAQSSGGYCASTGKGCFSCVDGANNYTSFCDTNNGGAVIPRTPGTTVTSGTPQCLLQNQVKWQGDTCINATYYAGTTPIADGYAPGCYACPVRGRCVVSTALPACTGVCNAPAPSCGQTTTGVDTGCGAPCNLQGEACPCFATSCNAAEPACGQTTFGVNNCGTACNKVGDQCVQPFLKTTGGDVHSNTNITTPGGPR